MEIKEMLEYLMLDRILNNYNEEDLDAMNATDEIKDNMFERFIKLEDKFIQQYSTNPNITDPLKD